MKTHFNHTTFQCNWLVLSHIFNSHGSVLFCKLKEFSQCITLMDPQQNRSIANPNCEKIRLGLMNLTVSNGSNGDGHANITKKDIPTKTIKRCVFPVLGLRI